MRAIGMTSQCETSGKKHIFLSQTQNPPEYKKGYRTSGILARGYRRKDLLTHFFTKNTDFFLRNYLRGSKKTSKENTYRINILHVTWWQFPVLLINSPKLLSFTDVHNYALRLLLMFSYNRKHIHSDRNFSPGNKNVSCT